MLDAADILKYLECQPGSPGIRSLNRLYQAYLRKVPWETVFRISKRAAVADPKQCPRWPAEFWQDAIQSGGGGTCYESNYAFFYLLQSLGYSGYLTINDMGALLGCHSAIVITLHGRKYLVDVGIPLLTTLLIDPGRVTHRHTWLHTYTLHPDGADCYQVLRSRHPKPHIYTLQDTPVSDFDYRRTIEQDYGEEGQFLDRVIVVKIIGERLWRFSSVDQPYHLEWFGKNDRGDVPVAPNQVPNMLADLFQMDEGRIRDACEALNI